MTLFYSHLNARLSCQSRPVMPASHAAPAAFEVASLEDAEVRLKHFKIEYHKFLVPGTNAAQIFFYDPEG